MKIACVLIVTANRVALVKEKVLPSVLAQGFDEVLWVGDGEPGDGYRYLNVPKILASTIDALVKRDVGTLATDADVIVYLCDDHALDPKFGTVLRDMCAEGVVDTWDIIAPARYTIWKGQWIPLSMGWEEHYVGGHAGVYKRHVIQHCPWSARPHHRNYDRIITHLQLQEGFKVVGITELLIEDLEPEREPWR